VDTRPKLAVLEAARESLTWLEEERLRKLDRHGRRECMLNIVSRCMSQQTRSLGYDVEGY
jgi:hypothetical protein